MRSRRLLRTIADDDCCDARIAGRLYADVEARVLFLTGGNPDALLREGPICRFCGRSATSCPSKRAAVPCACRVALRCLQAHPVPRDRPGMSGSPVSADTHPSSRWRRGWLAPLVRVGRSGRGVNCPGCELGDARVVAAAAGAATLERREHGVSRSAGTDRALRAPGASWWKRRPSSSADVRRRCRPPRVTAGHHRVVHHTPCEQKGSTSSVAVPRQPAAPRFVLIGTPRRSGRRSRCVRSRRPTWSSGAVSGEALAALLRDGARLRPTSAHEGFGLAAAEFARRLPPWWQLTAIAPEVLGDTCCLRAVRATSLATAARD